MFTLFAIVLFWVLRRVPQNKQDRDPLEAVFNPSAGTIRRYKSVRNTHLLPCKLRFLIDSCLVSPSPEVF